MTDNQECKLCAGSGEIETQNSLLQGVTVGCPECMEREWQSQQAQNARLREAAEKLSFGLVHDDLEWEGSEFTSEWFGKLQDALAENPAASLAHVRAQAMKDFKDELLKSVSVIFRPHIEGVYAVMENRENKNVSQPEITDEQGRPMTYWGGKASQSGTTMTDNTVREAFEATLLATNEWSKSNFMRRGDKYYDWELAAMWKGYQMGQSQEAQGAAVHLETLAKIAESEDISVEVTHDDYDGPPTRFEQDISEHVAKWIRGMVPIFGTLRSGAPAAVPEENPASPIGWRDRFVHSLTIITGQIPPLHLVDEWISHESDRLQDWVGATSAPWWLQNIGVIEAAHVMAETPIEGEPDVVDYAAPTPAEPDKGEHT